MSALTHSNPPAPEPERLTTAALEAQSRIIEETEEWLIADEEGGDGGSAVKLVPALQVAEARQFEAAMRRAQKAEEKSNKRYAADERKGSSFRGRVGGGGAKEEYPALQQASAERKVEVKFHAAKEAVPPHMRAVSKRDAEQNLKDQHDITKADPNKNLSDIGNKPKEALPLPARAMERLALMDDDDDDDYGWI